MRLRQIEVFHAVYSSGSMTNAAAMLNVSQPSVSKVLAHAEQQLGFQLFERNKGKLIPTPEADRLFKHVSDVYQHIGRLKHVAGNLRTAGAGRIRIAGTPAFGLELLPKSIAAFRVEHPETVFEVETLHFDELCNALLESRIDIGLAFDPLSHPAIEQQQLATGRFVVIAPTSIDFGDVKELTIGELAALPFIGLNSRGPLGRLLSTHLATTDVDLDVAVWAETYHIARALVACGAGVAIIDEITARSGAGGEVQILPLKPKLTFDIKALHLSSAPLSIAANYFVDVLKKRIETFVA